MPGDAIKEIKKELYLMIHKSREMLELTEEAFSRSKLASLDKAAEISSEIHAKEDVLTAKLAKLAASASEARALLTLPGSIEKIATTIQRIQDNTRSRIKDGILFSDKAITEAGALFARSKEALKKAGDAVVTGGNKAVDEVISESNDIEKLVSTYSTAHEDRIISGECSPKSSSIYLCVLYAFEDMAGYIKDTMKRVGG